MLQIVCYLIKTVIKTEVQFGMLMEFYIFFLNISTSDKGLFRNDVALFFIVFGPPTPLLPSRKIDRHVLLVPLLPLDRDVFSKHPLMVMFSKRNTQPCYRFHVLARNSEIFHWNVSISNNFCKFLCILSYSRPMCTEMLKKPIFD